MLFRKTLEQSIKDPKMMDNILDDLFDCFPKACKYEILGKEELHPLYRQIVALKDYSDYIIASVMLSCWPDGDQYLLQVDLIQGEFPVIFQVYTLEEVLDNWDIREDVLWSWIHSNRFGVHETRKSGDTWLFTRSAIEKLLFHHKNPETEIVLSYGVATARLFRSAILDPSNKILYDDRIEIWNLKKLYDFLAEHVDAKVIVLEEFLLEIICCDGSYELSSSLSKDGNPKNLYFEREDIIDHETGDIVKQIIRF